MTFGWRGRNEIETVSVEDDPARERLVAKIDAVRERFLVSLDARRRGLIDLCNQATGEETGPAGEARLALRRGLHNLAGAAATLGLTELGRDASDIEAVVVAAIAGDRPFDASLTREVIARLEGLAQG
jgi:chemotaxis protein histidine kinase CheA